MTSIVDHTSTQTSSFSTLIGRLEDTIRLFAAAVGATETQGRFGLSQKVSRVSQQRWKDITVTHPTGKTALLELFTWLTTPFAQRGVIAVPKWLHHGGPAALHSDRLVALEYTKLLTAAVFVLAAVVQLAGGAAVTEYVYRMAQCLPETMVPTRAIALKSQIDQVVNLQGDLVFWILAAIVATLSLEHVAQSVANPMTWLTRVDKQLDVYNEAVYGCTAAPVTEPPPEVWSKIVRRFRVHYETHKAIPIKTYIEQAREYNARLHQFNVFKTWGLGDPQGYWKRTEPKPMRHSAEWPFVGANPTRRNLFEVPASFAAELSAGRAALCPTDCLLRFEGQSVPEIVKRNYERVSEDVIQIVANRQIALVVLRTKDCQRPEHAHELEWADDPRAVWETPGSFPAPPPDPHIALAAVWQEPDGTVRWTIYDAFWVGIQHVAFGVVADTVAAALNDGAKAAYVVVHAIERMSPHWTGAIIEGGVIGRGICWAIFVFNVAVVSLTADRPFDAKRAVETMFGINRHSPQFWNLWTRLVVWWAAEGQFYDPL